MVCHHKLVSRIEIGLMTEFFYLEQHMQLNSRVHQFSCSQGIYSCGHQSEKYMYIMCHDIINRNKTRISKGRFYKYNV